MKNISKLVLTCAILAAMVVSTKPANADAFTVFVGYADGLRGPGFFPNIWDGSPNTHFIGTTPAYDAGAIRIDNTSGAAITVNSIDVSMPWSGWSSGNLWGTDIVVNPGEHLVLTETAHYNFDTSDFGVTQPVGVPLPDGETAHATHVDVMIDGILYNLLDTGHILTTGGFDYASIGNESFNWRPIGTTGIGNPGGVPEPSSFVLLGLGGLGFAVRAYRRRRAAAV
jgi:hypothetical protein